MLLQFQQNEEKAFINSDLKNEIEEHDDISEEYVQEEDMRHTSEKKTTSFLGRKVEVPDNLMNGTLSARLRFDRLISSID